MTVGAKVGKDAGISARDAASFGTRSLTVRPSGMPHHMRVCGALEAVSFAVTDPPATCSALIGQRLY